MLYEEPLLVKLSLSRNFPRKVLYSRKSALGIGIMMLSTIMNMLRAKLYLSNKQKEGIANEVIKLQEEYLVVESGRMIGICYNKDDRYWKKLWIDKVSDMFSSRNISLHQNDVNILAIIKNKTVMDLAVQYTQRYNLSNNNLQEINFMRKKKRVFLPVELVGESGRYQIVCYSDILSNSQIEWKFLPRINEASTRK